MTPSAPAVDLRPLGWSRAAIGAVFLARTTPLLWPIDRRFVDAWPLLGWPQGGFNVEPALIALPSSLVAALCIARTIGAGLLMFGVWSRVAGIAAGVFGYLVLFQNPFGFSFTLHLLYQAAILLAVCDADSAFALRPRPPRAPLSSVWLIRLFVASIYCWAAIYKIGPDWLDGRTLELFHREGTIHGALADEMLRTPGLRAFTGTGIALLELTLGPALLWQRTRRVALVVAYAFHAALELGARPELLGWGMASLLLCFLNPHEARRPAT